MTKQGIIKQHIKKLNELFKNVEENKKELLKTLIENCAFMEVQLSEMQTVLNNDETTKTERKEVIQQYNSMSKNYLSCLGKLMDYLPNEERTDELSEFLSKRKK